MSSTILIIDDEKDIRQLMAKTFQYEDYHVLTAERASEAIALLKSEKVHVAICDIKLPDANGIALTTQIKQISPETEVICLTAYGNIQDGVKAMKNGAFDYLVKGDDNHKIIPMVSKAVEKAVLQYRVSDLEGQVARKYGFENILGDSPKIREAVGLAQKVAPTDTTVLLTGPTGTGKEVFARAIHAHSARKHKKLVAVNCSAFGKDLLESELFGYKAGAFTGATKDKKGLYEEADGGTLFLDEIGELNLDLQAKLLRVLETGTFLKLGGTRETEVNVRVVAATNRDLERESVSGAFREDLYFRLSMFQIQLPSLNERKEDLALFAKRFVEEFSIKLNKKVPSIDRGYMEALRRHQWRGNVRELRNIVERSMILCDGDALTEELLPFSFGKEGHGNSGEISLKDMERSHILKTLSESSGNKTNAAKRLGIGLTTLYRKMEEYGIKD